MSERGREERRKGEGEKETEIEKKSGAEGKQMRTM